MNGPRALAAFVLVLGLALVVPALGDVPATAERTATVGMFEAMQQARTPLWLMLLNPLTGAAGVLLGGRSAVQRAEPVGQVVR